MRHRVAILFLIVLTGVFAIGCGTNITGSEFIGKWVKSDRASETTEIKRNGENFIVTQIAPTFVGKVANNGEKKAREYPAVLKDGILTATTGSEPLIISYVKDGDYLLVSGQNFIRQK
ncbi:MAG TPA: hypothetical protein VGL27_04150 [Negativicutes bacterium]|jgi:hypothetical protein